MRTSLFARVSPNKPFGGATSLYGATQRTKASTSGNPNTARGDEGFGAVKQSVSSTPNISTVLKSATLPMSPFREAIQRGFVSGAGMLSK